MHDEPATPDDERRNLARGIPPRWASAWGDDEYGVFACLRVGEAIQRMRWIRPSSFWMGSPADEYGRYEDEGPQHVVTLTQGFWLADTPCTQALWEAVMTSNPSRFRSPRRPVERVSWDDVQKFLRALNRHTPGHGLPSEAQWEYACRALASARGAELPHAPATYAGPLQLRGAHDAPVLDEIAWYGGNSGFDFDLDAGVDMSDLPEKQYPDATWAGTREVASKRPNQWGLYDMLGNVFEWCGDFKRTYAQQPMTNPFQATGRYRAYRGGSWRSGARDARSALRRWHDPGLREVDLGFRLARGQQVASQDGR